MATIANFNLQGKNQSGMGVYPQYTVGLSQVNTLNYDIIQHSMSGDSDDTVFFLAQPVNVSVVNDVITVKSIDGTTLTYEDVNAIVIPGVNVVSEVRDKANDKICYKLYHTQYHKSIPTTKQPNIKVCYKASELLHFGDKITFTKDTNNVDCIKKATKTEASSDIIFGEVVTERAVNANEIVEVMLYGFNNLQKVA